MRIAIDDVVVTDDGERWRVYSITEGGVRRSFVALHVSSHRALSGDVAQLKWSSAEGVWRLANPGALP